MSLRWAQPGVWKDKDHVGFVYLGPGMRYPDILGLACFLSCSPGGSLFTMVRGMPFNLKDSHVISLAWNLGTHLPLLCPFWFATGLFLQDKLELLS